MKGATIPITLAILVAGGLITWAATSQPPQTTALPSDAATAITQSDGSQLIEINAKAGYTPRLTIAKAGVATTLRVTTKNTYDCSVSLVIPKLKYEKFLSPDAVTDIAISAEQARGTLTGLCGMGMYSFKINFQSDNVL
jgi:plastocyanin domain-containing protein